jgi:hypothetical protein
MVIFCGYSAQVDKLEVQSSGELEFCCKLYDIDKTR